MKNTVRFCYIMTRALAVPFWGLLALIPFILHQELLAPATYIAIAVALKPSAALLSPYWSSWVHSRRDRLVKNLVWGNLVKYIPFLFFPIFAPAPFCLLALGLFMMLSRGMMPAWMEILKLHMSHDEQKKLCAVGAMIDYIGALILPFVFGWVLDHFDSAWRYLFPLSALMGMSACLLILKMQSPRLKAKKNVLGESTLSMLKKPWKGSFELLKQRPDFFRFQLGFFLGGAGLMLMHAVIPVYFTDTLGLSYKELLLAISTFKGVGFVLSTPLWVKAFSPRRIFGLCALVILIAALFPLLLIGAVQSHLWLYLAYASYGVMQGGSELCWKMAGSSFAGKGDSAPFSSFSVMAVGVRGLIFPLLGGLLLAYTGQVFLVMMFGMVSCLFASTALILPRKRAAASLS